MKNINWQTRDDGVIHFDPAGFEESYYIYPAKYNENSSIQLNMIKDNGQVTSAANCNSVEEAQQLAEDMFKNIITHFVDII